MNLFKDIRYKFLVNLQFCVIFENLPKTGVFHWFIFTEL